MLPGKPAQCDFWGRGRYVRRADLRFCLSCKQHIDAPTHDNWRARRALNLARAVVAESSGNPTAAPSPGLMQTIPPTFTRYRGGLTP